MCCANHLLFFPQSTTRAINGYCLKNSSYFSSFQPFFFFKDLNNKFNIWNYLACPLSKLEAVLSVFYKPVLAIDPMPVNVL